MTPKQQSWCVCPFCTGKITAAQVRHYTQAHSREVAEQVMETNALLSAAKYDWVGEPPYFDRPRDDT